ncbi:hypothetical protein OF83DRAFT_1096298 [Amylostereum chailletii]|nr:hypothetical protein OF83DRAFT_1096298 [Amylostereum chailletii]
MWQFDPVWLLYPQSGLSTSPFRSRNSGMDTFWSRFPDLTVKILEETREQDPGIEVFFDPGECLDLDRDARRRLALSFKISQLQRFVVSDNKWEHRKTLARCARVCRSLSEHALTLLWSEVHTMDAIYSLFSPKQLPTSAMDWAPFEAIHKNIHSLALRDEDPGTRRIDLLKRHLVNYPHGSSLLLPNLKTMVWDTLDLLSLLSADILLSNHLRSLDLRAPVTTDHQCTPVKLLYQISHQAPALTYLSLTGSFVTTQSLDAFQNISRLPQLCEFKLLQDQGWIQFPTQEQLSVVDRPRGQMPPCFPSLLSLTLQGSAYYIMAIFDHLGCFPQQHVCLRLTMVPTAQDLSAIFQRIATGRPGSRIELEHVEVSLVSHSLAPLHQEDPSTRHYLSLFERAAAQERVVRIHSLAPLACLRSLRPLELRQLGVMVSLREEDIMWMTAAWPELTFLGLDTHTIRLDLPATPSEHPQQAAVPITSMHLFARFRHLQVLKINVQLLDRSVLFRLIENMDAWAARESADVHPLWGINLDLSPIHLENQEPIAEYLRRIFPRLALLKRCSDENVATRGIVPRWQKNTLSQYVEYTVKRSYDIKDVIPLTSKKWQYRAWCL